MFGVKFYEEYKRKLWTDKDIDRLMEYRSKSGASHKNKQLWKSLGLKTSGEVSIQTELSPGKINYCAKILGIKFYEEYGRILWTDENIDSLVEYLAKDCSEKLPWSALGLKTSRDIAKQTGMRGSLVQYYKKRLGIKYYKEFNRFLWTSKDVDRLLEYIREKYERKAKKHIRKRHEQMREQGFMIPSDIKSLFNVSQKQINSYYNHKILKTRQKGEAYRLGVWDRSAVQGLLNQYKIHIPDGLLDDYFNQNETSKIEVLAKETTEPPDTK
jgi:hypothetical protein